MNEQLFKPFFIGKMETRNRFVRSGTWEGMATDDGEVTDDLIVFHRRLANGGVGLIISSFAYITEKGKANPGMLGIHNDSVIPGLKKLVDVVHEGGAKFAMQLVHSGSQSKVDTGLGTVAPSAIKERVTGNLPSPLSRNDIKRIIEDFATAAGRAKEAGFDSVEIHAAHGYLLSQFLSPYSNQRSDAYGGPIKKRGRIIFEVYESIRKEVGPDFPIMIKINASDFVESGLTSEDSLWVCEKLSTLGIDAIELSGGIPAALTLASARKHILKPETEAYFKEYAQALKPLIKCPLILVGGVRSPEIMEEIFDKGTADMFSFARPLISEPELINRWMSGDTKPARCVSCNKCLKAAHIERRLYCVHFAEEDKKAGRTL